MCKYLCLILTIKLKSVFTVSNRGEHKKLIFFMLNTKFHLISCLFYLMIHTHKVWFESKYSYYNFCTFFNVYKINNYIREHQRMRNFASGKVSTFLRHILSFFFYLLNILTHAYFNTAKIESCIIIKRCRCIINLTCV